MPRSSPSEIERGYTVDGALCLREASKKSCASVNGANWSADISNFA
jgi:hypothetical protein